MRYMLIMRSTPEAEEASKDIPFEEIINAMGRYNEELIKAGVMLAGEGLAPPEDGGFVVDFNSDPPVVTDGPYAEAKDLVLGFMIVEARDLTHAARLATGCPIAIGGGSVEVRPIGMSPSLGDAA